MMRILGVILIAVGCLGISGNFKALLSMALKMEDLLLIGVPFASGCVLFVAGIGLFLKRIWGHSLASIGVLGWLISGVVGIWFAWHFEPWGEVSLWEKFRNISGFIFFGVLIPLGLMTVLRKRINGGIPPGND